MASNDKLIRFVKNYNCEQKIKNDAIDLINSGNLTAQYEVSAFITGYPESKKKYDAIRQGEDLKRQRQDAVDAMLGYVKCPNCGEKFNYVTDSFCPKCDAYFSNGGYIPPTSMNHPHYHSRTANMLLSIIVLVLVIIFVIAYLIVSFIFGFFNLTHFAVIAAIGIVIIACLLSKM